MYAVLNARPDFGIAEFEVPAVERFAGVVTPTPIPVFTDEEILFAAEQYNDWDRLERYEYGTEGSISLRGLTTRFTDKYMVGKRSDEAMGIPGAFIEAIWESQRQIPTVGEYAAVLGEQGLLNPDEVAVASKVSQVERGVGHTILSARFEDDERDAAFAGMDEDARWLFDRVHSKLAYFVNLTPDAIIDGDNGRDVGRLAADYASKRTRGANDDKRFFQARDMLLEARGLSRDEIKAVHASQGRDRILRYRALGMPIGMAEQMVERPQASFMRPLSDVDNNVEKALDSNLNTQLAVRKFFGTESLYELLGYQARADRLIRAQVSENKAAVRSFTAALARGDEAEIERMRTLRQPEDEKGPETVFELALYSPEERDRFEALGAFAVHEPALKGVVAHFVSGAMMKHYRGWFDSQTGF